MKAPLGSFRVGRSETGLGLFATKSFRPPEWIVDYVGSRLPTVEAERRERKLRNKYMFKLNGRWTIDGSGRENLARYVNHSCKPNAKAFVERGRIRVRAFRVIHPGEEITINYGREYVTLFIGENCRCAECRSGPLSAPTKRRRG